MNGAVEMYKACREDGRQAHPGLRDLPRRRPRQPRPGQGRAQPPHAAGRRRRGLPQPRQALVLRLPGGPAPRQAVARHGPARGPQPRASSRSPAASPRRFCQRLIDDRAGRGPRPRRRPAEGLRGRERLLRGPEERPRAQDKANEGIVRIAREVGRPLVATGDVHYLRREDYHHHTALLCVQTKSTLAAPKMTFETNEFYLQELQRGDGAGVRRVARGDPDRRWRSPSAATSRSSSGSQLIPRFLPEGEDETRLPAGARRGGAARPLRRSGPGRGASSAMEMRARRHRPDGLQRLLPDRLGLRQVGEGATASRSARAAARRPARSSPTPADHRRRPAALRPAVRALPEPRARVDAGHRHRLLRPRPRARDAVRDREVRP